MSHAARGVSVEKVTVYSAVLRFHVALMKFASTAHVQAHVVAASYVLMGRYALKAYVNLTPVKISPVKMEKLVF